MRRFGVLVATAVLAASFVGSGASAETLRLEGELRNRDAGFCAPDGERMMTVPWAGASGGQALFFPHSGCWAEWDFDGPVLSLSFAAIHPTGGASGTRECAAFDIALDGQVTRTAEHCSTAGQPADWEVFSIAEGLTIPAGRHTLRATMRITQGPSWANSYIDYFSVVGVLPGSPSEPLNVRAGWDLRGRAVVLGWDPPSASGDAPVTGYRIYRADAAQPERRIAEVGDVRTFTDSSVAPGGSFGYRVRAVNEIGEGWPSSVASVHVPGGVLFRQMLAAGPQQPIRVVELRGENDGGLYCVSAGIGVNPPSHLACVNGFGAPIPDTPPVVVEIPAGTTMLLEGRYYYEPERVVTAATVGGDRTVVRLPAGPGDEAWLAENAQFVSLDVLAGPQGTTTLSVPALGQVLGALHESKAAGLPIGP